MKTLVKKQIAKDVTKEVKQVTPLTKKQLAEIVAKKEAIKQKRALSHYGINCLDNHTKAKAHAKTEAQKIGFCIKFYLDTENTENEVTPIVKAFIKEVQKNSELYQRATNEVRKTKKGFYTPFYFLQWCTKELKPTTKK
jgi:polysaccharide deacetylase 2 family uncharacterized protein YibQ